jgi:hypothetical protein
MSGPLDLVFLIAVMVFWCSASGHIRGTLGGALSFAIATPPGTDQHVYTGDLRSGLLSWFAYSSGTPVS